MNEFELEEEKTRVEVASYVHRLASGVEAGDRVTPIVGDESVTIDSPETLHFKTKPNGRARGPAVTTVAPSRSNPGGKPTGAKRTRDYSSSNDRTPPRRDRATPIRWIVQQGSKRPPDNASL